MSPVSLEDYELRGRVTGNTSLRMVNVRNYDLRLESYFKKGDNASVSVFYKNFVDHIELLATPGGTNFTWANADKTSAIGIEFEGKKTLFGGFDIRGNVSFINSETTINGPITVKRQMFGQAPYIINGMLTYTNDSLRFTISGSYNVQGRKLAAVNIIGVDIPDVYELPQHMVDINAIKHFGKHFSVGFKIRNLLNTQIRRSYVFDSGYELDFDFYRWGTDYSISFAYKL
jgi:outer membrane receptor protein involved in Fe transport